MWAHVISSSTVDSADGQQLKESDSFVQRRTGLCRPFERREDPRCGHRVVTCVRLPRLQQWSSKSSTVDRLRARSSAGGQLPALRYPLTVFKPARVVMLPMESDSLAQGHTRTPDARPQCDLVTVPH